MAAGARVNPGDVIVADVDGVVVVPPEMAAEIAKAGNDRLVKEEESRQRLRNGELGLDRRLIARRTGSWVVGLSGIDVDFGVKAPDFAMRYAAPTPLVLHDDGVWRVTLRAGFSGSAGRDRVAMEEETSIDIEAATPRPPGAQTRAIPGHEFGLRLSAAERDQLIAHLRTL